MKNPIRYAKITLRRHGKGLGVNLRSDQTIGLEGTDAAVLLAADGTNDIDAIVDVVRRDVDASATRETVFLSLDRLADAGMLESRVTPPAGSNHATRRDMMRLAGAAAAYAVMAPTVSAFAQAKDLARTGEEHSKNVRDAEEGVKQVRRDLRASEDKAKLTWRNAEEKVKLTRQDWQEAKRAVRSSGRDVRAAEKEHKRYKTKDAEEQVKGAEKALQEARRLSEQENKLFTVAKKRAGEAKEKAVQARGSEERAKKTNVSETARAGRRGGSASEQTRK